VNRKQFILASSVLAGCLSATSAACSAGVTTQHTGTQASHTTVKHATKKPAPKPSTKPATSTVSGLPLLDPGKTVSWTWNNNGELEHYKWALTKAVDLGKTSTDSKYDVEALYLTITNTGTTPDDADPLTPMVWVGTDGKVDQTIGGFAAMNDATEAQTGTDISLNTTLAPGQYEEGYLDVAVINSEPGVIFLPGFDANYNEVDADSLIINYAHLSDSTMTATSKPAGR
jgi:hypothetical protein